MSEDKKATMKISFLVAVIAILAFIVYRASVKTGASVVTAHQEIEAEQTEAQALPEHQEENTLPQAPRQAAVPATLPALTSETEILRKTPLNEKEIRSVSQLSSMIFKGMKAHANAAAMANAIKAAGLKPSVNVDENPYTGRMTILRTEDALDGTRYLHIQMGGNSAKDEVAQHSSFQLRPGMDSFDKAVGIVQKNLPPGSTVKESGSQYKSWILPDCYEARVHAMDMDDLQSSKYNAVSKDDVGTINVVVEQDPHCGADHGHDH